MLLSECVEQVSRLPEELMKRQIIVHECEVRTLPDGRVEMVTKAVAGSAQEVNEVGVDEAIAAAKALLTAQKREVRSLGIRSDGNIQAVVWKNGRPSAPVDRSWIWKRPKAQPVGG